MYKLYIFGSLIFYLLYIFISSTYSTDSNDSTNCKNEREIEKEYIVNNRNVVLSSVHGTHALASIEKNLEYSFHGQRNRRDIFSDNHNDISKIELKKNKFIDEIIHKYAYFLDKEKKKILEKDMFRKNKFFEIIDELYLGKEIKKNKNISTFFLVGKAFMTTYLDSTPNCLRIVNNSHKNYESGYIYTEFCSKKIKEIDQLKIICGGILFHNIYTDKKVKLSDEDSLLLQRLKRIYSLNDIIDDIYSIIYKNQSKLLRLRCILENNKSILYDI